MQMPRINRSNRRWLALFIWVAGVALFAGLGWWNLASSRQDAENRLINEAARTAAQIAALFGLQGDKLDEGSARSLVRAAMDDESLYAIRIETRSGIQEGQRRNYLWEPVEWDNEISENCVEGMNPIRIGGRNEGVVEVWLSPRLSGEEEELLRSRERLRFICITSLWTLALALLFWYWGDFRRLRQSWRKYRAAQNGTNEVKPEPGQNKTAEQESQKPPLVSARAGRAFQRKQPAAWLVTAGLFRQTFAHAPALISRLYSEGQLAALCHLGRMLEQAAPCLGATSLTEAARDMQDALNDPSCGTRAMAVEQCAHILEQTLTALSDWRSMDCGS